MPRRPREKQHCVVTMMLAGELDAARAEMMRTLVLACGSTIEAAKIAECSWAFYKHLLGKLGMRGEPAKVKARARARFRLPLVDGAYFAA